MSDLVAIPFSVFQRGLTIGDCDGRQNVIVTGDRMWLWRATECDCVEDRMWLCRRQNERTINRAKRNHGTLICVDQRNPWF